MHRMLTHDKNMSHVLYITLADIDRFSKIFSCWTQQ